MSLLDQLKGALDSFNIGVGHILDDHLCHNPRGTDQETLEAVKSASGFVNPSESGATATFSTMYCLARSSQLKPQPSWQPLRLFSEDPTFALGFSSGSQELENRHLDELAKQQRELDRQQELKDRQEAKDKAEEKARWDKAFGITAADPSEV